MPEPLSPGALLSAYAGGESPLSDTTKRCEMKEREVTLAEQIDAKLTISAMRKRVQLWRIAEGRMRWGEGISFLAPLLLIGIGIARLAQEDGLMALLRESETRGIAYVVIGIVMLVSCLFTHRERQLNALIEIVKRLERDRS